MFGDICVPTLLLDEVKCRENIRRMAEKAAQNGVVLRPHFKTHQSVEIGEWFRDCKVERITVSSLAMAKYFADAGWKDITVAFPVNVREVKLINALSAQVNLHLLMQHREVVQILSDSLDHPVNGWIKIDVGTGRTGLLPGQEDEIGRILELMDRSATIRISGLMAHAGHAYSGGSPGRMAEIHGHTAQILKTLARHFGDRYPGLQVSAGDTPCYSMIDHFGDLDEIRPGNFVFYDMMQAHLGSCQVENIAVAMACPVVALHPERQDAILYGGGIHFSKDFYLNADKSRNFGQLALWKGDHWEAASSGSYMKSLSQEHGILHCSPEDFKRIRVGDLALILPVHSCMTANLIGQYRTIDGVLVDHFSRSHTRMKLN